ncbi:hypothetical protein ABNB56_11240 [Streptococcus iniae]|uniref:hypothetical protein n=1 Tax=Streptococcus iniae TaxID=1346 RepID=UPI000EFC20A0|nr:hypothetical protein [Streptococcus iniae]RMI77619.1 hypothetical protein DIX58_04055 [Streptococcus iniae]
MENFFVIIILMSGIGVWYFAKKRPNKKYRNFSIGLLLLSFILFYIVSPKQKEENVFKPIVSSIEKKEKKKAESNSSVEAKAEEVKKDTKTKESSTPSSSSEEPFEPETYPLVDFNEWNHDKVTLASKIQVTGTVIQAMKSNEGMNLRLAINDDYDQVVLITIENSNYKDVIAEDDNVTVYGLNAGLTTYKTVMGNEQTIPAMLGTNYTVNSYGQ